MQKALPVLALVVALIAAYAAFSAGPSFEKAGSTLQTSLTQSNVSVKGFTQGGGVLRISQATATRTLTENELIANSEIVIDSTAGAAALSLTLPATSTMDALLPSPGDTRTWFIENNHTAAATTTTVVAGAGIDLQGTATGSDVIDGGVAGIITCIRQYTTDVLCDIRETVAAD